MTARTPRLTQVFRSAALLLLLVCTGLGTACKTSLQPAPAPRSEAANEFVVSPVAGEARVRVSAVYKNLNSEPTVDLLLPDRHSFVQVEPR